MRERTRKLFAVFQSLFILLDGSGVSSLLLGNAGSVVNPLLLANTGSVVNPLLLENAGSGVNPLLIGNAGSGVNPLLLGNAGSGVNPLLIGNAGSGVNPLLLGNAGSGVNPLLIGNAGSGVNPLLLGNAGTGTNSLWLGNMTDSQLQAFLSTLISRPVYEFSNLQQGQPLPILRPVPPQLSPPLLSPPAESGFCYFIRSIVNYFASIQWTSSYNNQYYYSGGYYDPYYQSYPYQQTTTELSYQDSSYDNTVYSSSTQSGDNTVYSSNTQSSGNSVSSSNTQSASGGNSDSSSNTVSSDSTDYSYLEQGWSWSSGADVDSSSSSYEEPDSAPYNDDSTGRRTRHKRDITVVEFDFSDITYSIIVVYLLVLQSGVLSAFGQSFFSRTGEVKFWDGDVFGIENSQQFTDWYTFTHVVHGFVIYEILYLIAPNTSFGYRLVIAMAVEVAWEVIENTPVVIKRYRETTLAQGYAGDSILNSIGDTLAMGLGFWIAEKVPASVIIALIVIEELVLAAIIRDNLSLIILSLLSPNGPIRKWQEEGRRPKPQFVNNSTILN